MIADRETMNLATTSSEDKIVVAVSGRVDALESSGLAAAIDHHLDAGEPNLIIDLFDVDYIDSSGLAVLVRTWRRQTDANRRYAVRLPAVAAARRVFSLTGFDLVFEILEEEHSATT